MTGTDVQGTLREMWETRPARPRDDRQVAGVAAGIARRYDIDPVLVRVGFVVAAFFGIGAALYIAGWILLPEAPTDPAHPVQRRAPRGVLVVALAIAAAVSLGAVFGGGNDIVLPTLAVAALLLLLHRSRADRGPGGSATAAQAPTTAAPVGPSMVKDPGGPPVTPPAWDPLGAAPFAWDLPEPSGPPPAPPRRRLPVTPVTLGLALLAGGITALILLLAGALSLANLPVLFGVALAVIGAGLVGGSFVRSGRGLIPIALLLTVLTWAVLSAPLDRWQGNGVGDLHAAPTTVAALQPSYERTAGRIDLDLSNIDLAVPPGGNASPVRTRVSLGAGEVQVRVPRDADLRLNASAGIGDVVYGDRAGSGPGADVTVNEDLGADGVRSGRLLVLDVETGAGNVEVRRG